jgi:hypothetical protein
LNVSLYWLIQNQNTNTRFVHLCSKKICVQKILLGKMAWAAAALLAKKKAEASLAAVSVSAAAQEESLSYIQRAARKVRGLSAAPRVGGSAHPARLPD